MNSKEIKAYKCSDCNQSYLDKSVADKCCQPKHCEDCGIELSKTWYYTVCSGCKTKREEIKELERYNKATKYTFDNVPKESIEYVFSELYPYNEGYFYADDTDIDEHNIKYVYGTKRVSPSYDVSDMIESMLEDSFEDANDQVGTTERDKLQLAIDTFINNHNGSLDHFEVDYSIVIDL